MSVTLQKDDPLTEIERKLDYVVPHSLLREIITSVNFRSYWMKLVRESKGEETKPSGKDENYKRYKRVALRVIEKYIEDEESANGHVRGTDFVRASTLVEVYDHLINEFKEK